jgi:pyruvate dehydrogenase E2 component (dihydrolipoamide acetyltransferase)
MATPVILPKQGNTVESCILQKWHKQPGDTVAEGEVLCEAETDKAVIEIPAPCAGTLLAVFFAAADEVPVMTTIAALGLPGEDASALRPARGPTPTPAADAPAAEAVPVPAATPTGPAGGGAATAGSSPRARALARKLGVVLAGVAGTGPGGCVIERDVRAAPRLSPVALAEAQRTGKTAPAAGGTGPGGLVLAADLVHMRQAQAAIADAGPTIRAAGEHEIIPVKSLRKIVGERMMASLHGTAQLTINSTFRATALQEYRAEVKALVAAGKSPDITLGDMIVYAVARVLPEFPAANAHFLGDQIIRYREVHLGVAVDTPRGLMVPVIASAQAKTLAAIAETFKPLAAACQKGTIEPDRLKGGTFTITNLGALGIDHFTPVLNAPEVAILGVGGIHLRPYPGTAGGVAFLPAITLSLTVDHQALDGAPAARFLKRLGEALENFRDLL